MATISSIPGLDAALANLDAGKDATGRVIDKDGVRGTYADLPETQEFRVEITEAAYRKATTGTEGITYVLTIVDDGGLNQVVGQKVWDAVYFTGHEMQGQIFGTLLASANAPRSGLTLEQSAEKLVGGKLVIAVKPGNDPRYPRVRWMNVDVGQKLNMSVKPYKARGVTAGLDATLPSAAVPASPPSAPAAEVPKPVVAPGIKLPGA